MLSKKTPIMHRKSYIDVISAKICSIMPAFTLAEVLITLGIIGVVAALTIPSLIAAHKAHRLRAQFLKSYSTVQQVFKQMEADDVSLDPSTYPSRTFYKTFMKYLQTPFDCGPDGLNRNENKRYSLCYEASSKSANHYKTFDGNSTVSYTYFDDGQIALQDGTLVMIENHTGRIWVSVDINGYNNPPNRWGYDLFTFEFLDGELRTMGDIQTSFNKISQSCNHKTSGGSNGAACAHRAKTESDYFKWVVKNIK